MSVVDPYIVPTSSFKHSRQDRNNEREDSKIAKMKKIQKLFKEATFVVGFSWFAFAKTEYRSFFL